MDRELRTQARLSKRTLTTQADIGNTVYGTEVHSVNGKAGHVVLTAEDVGALPSDTPIPSLDGYATEEWVQEQGYATLADIPPEKFLFVNMTAENESYVLDHTYEEIRQAIDDGMYPIIVDADGKSTLYPLTYKTASGLMFSTTQGSANWTIQLTSSLVNKVNTKLATKAEIPTVPTDVSAFNNDAGYLTEHQDLTPYALKSEIPVVPTNVSAFNNDAGYLTQHQDLSDYALKSELPTVPTDVSAFTNDVGYLSDAYFIIGLSNNNGTYSIDCTFADIVNAYQSGKIPILRNSGGGLYPMTSIDTSATGNAVFTYVNFYTCYRFQIIYTGTVLSNITVLARQSDIPTVPTDVSAFTNDAGYLSDSYFVVTITSNNGIYTIDCTFEDIVSAYQSGKLPIAKLGTVVFPMTVINDSERGNAVFGGVIWNTYYRYQIAYNGTVIYTTMSLAQENNVYTKAEIDSMIGDIETLLQGI